MSTPPRRTRSSTTKWENRQCRIDAAVEQLELLEVDPDAAAAQAEVVGGVDDAERGDPVAAGAEHFAHVVERDPAAVEGQHHRQAGGAALHGRRAAG